MQKVEDIRQQLSLLNMHIPILNQDSLAEERHRVILKEPSK